jgi:hypothetical protein
MRTILSALVFLSVLPGIAATPASAQLSPGYAPPPPRPPVVTINPYDRGPPFPPDRSYPSPRSEIAPPMEQAPPIAPLAPRIED